MKDFYCQECGTKVPLNAESCPECKCRFSSVLCPKCGYSGSSYKFENGCPKCGYLSIKKVEKEKALTLRRFLSLFALLLSLISLLVFYLVKN